MNFTMTEAANFIGVSTTTMRRLEESGKLVPLPRAQGKHRRYPLEVLNQYMASENSNTPPTYKELALVKEAAEKYGGIERFNSMLDTMAALANTLGNTYRVQSALQLLIKLQD